METYGGAFAPKKIDHTRPERQTVSGIPQHPGRPQGATDSMPRTRVDKPADSGVPTWGFGLAQTQQPGWALQDLQKRWQETQKQMPHLPAQVTGGQTGGHGGYDPNEWRRPPGQPQQERRLSPIQEPPSPAHQAHEDWLFNNLHHQRGVGPAPGPQPAPVANFPPGFRPGYMPPFDRSGVQPPQPAATHPDWIIPPDPNSPVSQALETHTNPLTGETWTAPTGGYQIHQPQWGIDPRSGGAGAEMLGDKEQEDLRKRLVLQRMGVV